MNKFDLMLANILPGDVIGWIALGVAGAIYWYWRERAHQKRKNDNPYRR